MSWLHVVSRDPVPWLLDPANPSARYLALRDIFQRPETDLRTDREAILRWAPVQDLIEKADPVSFWGRAENSYFGGPLGNFGTLYSLAQAGAPGFPLAEKVCEHLLQRGRRADGRFAPPGFGPITWLCYTGMALQILWHFGFGEDPRTESSKNALVEAVLLNPAALVCALSGNVCAWGLVKALSGLLSIPPAHRTADDQTAIQQVTQRLLDHPFNFDGRNADWLSLRFPRYYESDIVELSHILAYSADLQHPRFLAYVRRMETLQTPQGRWPTSYATGGRLDVETLHQPSRWLTWEAVHTLMLVHGGNAYAS